MKIVLVEILIGIMCFALIIGAVVYIHGHGLHLSDYDRVIWHLKGVEGFSFKEEVSILKQIEAKPAKFAGIALDDTSKKLLCYDGGLKLVCDYDQILEWQVLANNRIVASISRLCSSELKVDQPDENLSLEEFLHKYVSDVKEPHLESVHMKLLLRDLSRPVHRFSMISIVDDKEYEAGLRQALSWADRFKVMMHQRA